MIIRKAQTQDIPGILALLKQVGQVHHTIRPDIFPTGTLKYDETQLATLLQDTDRPIFIAAVEGAVAGYCFCVHKVIEDTPVSVERQELYIDDLCVDVNHRRMGIARALYDHARNYAKEIDCRMLTLNVWCGNQGAMQFYAQMGMKPRNIMMELSLEE